VQKLNFPVYQFRFKNSENKVSVFDILRKKFVVLQPEEWVRQHCVHYLLYYKKYPKSLLNVEKEIKINTLKKLIVECKAPHITKAQNTFDQIARYNLVLQSEFLMVTNGLTHYYCEMDYDAQHYHFLKDIPEYQP
jgi:Ni,Fe-hydrogenase I cytochrome b subunit